MVSRAPQVKIDVAIGKAALRLTKIQRKIEKEIPLTLKEAAEGGRDYARTQAPYWSGATFQNIRTLRGEDSHQYSVVAREPKTNTKPGFNLVQWMHTAQKAKSHIKSGDPQFMFTTADWLRQVAPQKVQGAVNKIALEDR